jgi:hypothetical protein
MSSPALLGALFRQPEFGNVARLKMPKAQRPRGFPKFFPHCAAVPDWRIAFSEKVDFKQRCAPFFVPQLPALT